jgi:hypothetical protein
VAVWRKALLLLRYVFHGVLGVWRKIMIILAMEFVVGRDYTDEYSVVSFMKTRHIAS